MERERLMSRLRRIEETYELRDAQDRAAIVEGLRAEDEEMREAAKEAAAGAMVDDLARDLVALIADASASDDARGDAAIALGPALEVCHYEGYEEHGEEMPLTAPVFAEVKQALESLYADESVSVLVRRRILEAAVRAPVEWQMAAIRTAWASDDADWRLTAVFCMGQVEGFRDELIAAMAADDLDLRCEAIFAAAEADMEEAGPEVIKLAQTTSLDKDVRMAAIHALAMIAPEGAPEALEALVDDEDPEISEMAQEALDELLLGEEDFDDDDEDLDDEDLDEEDDEDDEDDDDAPKKKGK